MGDISEDLLVRGFLKALDADVRDIKSTTYANLGDFAHDHFDEILHHLKAAAEQEEVVREQPTPRPLGEYQRGRLESLEDAVKQGARVDEEGYLYVPLSWLDYEIAKLKGGE